MAEDSKRTLGIILVLVGIASFLQSYRVGNNTLFLLIGILLIIIGAILVFIKRK